MDRNSSYTWSLSLIKVGVATEYLQDIKAKVSMDEMKLFQGSKQT